MKPLAALLSLSLVPLARATPVTPAQPKPSEALLAAACGTKGGLLVAPPDKSDKPAKDAPAPDPAAPVDEPESLFGPPEPADDAAPAKDGVAGDAAGTGKPAKPRVRQIKARGSDPKAAKKKCREDFREYYARNGDMKVAVAPDVEGDISPADRERLMAVLARATPLQPLKALTAKGVADQQGMSRRLFDAGTIKPESLSGAMDRATVRLDRRAADAAKQATMIASIHLRDQQRERERIAGQPLSPDLRLDPQFREAARAYTPAPSLSSPARNANKVEPAMTGPEPSVLKNLSLVDVPAPTAIPTSGISRGSIVADVKAALAGLGVNVLGRASWRPRYGQDSPQHTPMKITVHHSAGSPSHTDANLLGQIQGWENDHIKRGFGRMGYHWVINSLGTVVEGQGTELVGSHTLNNNRGNIGICLAGNYDKQEPSDKMLASLVGLMAYVGARYNMDTGSPDFVRGHEHYVRKSCPGNHVMSMLGHIREKAVALVLAQKKDAGVTVAAVVD